MTTHPLTTDAPLPPEIVRATLPQPWERRRPNTPLLRRKTDILPFHPDNKNTVEAYERLIHAHRTEAWCQEHLPRIHELAVYLLKLGRNCLDARPTDLRNFVGWVRKRTHSRSIARGYAVSLIDFYLLLLQEGAILSNPACLLYPILAEPPPAPHEDLDTRERMERLISVSSTLHRDTDEAFADLLPVRDTDPVAFPAADAAPSEATHWMRRVENKTFPFRMNWLMFVLAGASLLLMAMQSPFFAMWTRMETDETPEVITNQKWYLVNKSNPGESQRRDFFISQKIHTTFCKMVLNKSCQDGSVIRNPIEASWDNLVASQLLFRQHCQGCHGVNGKGSGQGMGHAGRLDFAGKGLLQKDAYLFWTIHEGGSAFHSTMPAYKEILRQEDIWRLVLFIKHL
ncbi:MAG: c-type cytochrome [Magnetococcales bacterium]|nr:c-type cytochrome [Magnetococcales bacterium]